MSANTGTSSSETPVQSAPQHAPILWLGIICAFIAAVGYTLANIALRQSARPDHIGWSMWVTAHKAVPACLLTWSLVLWNHYHRRPAFPPLGLVLPLIGTGMMMQFGGNLMFQYGLSLIGLAMVVPLTFSMILFAGAVFSRIYLGEPITNRALISMAILMISIVILSFGAEKASQALLETASKQQIMLGVVVALLAGTSYGIAGVVIRRNVKKLPVSATLFLISSTGVVAMSAAAFVNVPYQELAATTWKEVLVMQLAGVFNALAFYNIGYAFRNLNVTQVNMINTSQIAMAAVAGVMLFQEPITFWLVAGVVLTTTGLIIMERK